MDFDENNLSYHIHTKFHISDDLISYATTYNSTLILTIRTILPVSAPVVNQNNY